MKLRSGNIKDLPQSLARIQAISRPPYLPTELWMIIGEQIHNRDTMHALVLTCCAFREIFRPILHSHRLLELSNFDPPQLVNMPSRPTNAFVKSFEILLREWHKKVYHKNSNKLYLPFLIKTIDSMPNLQSFRWQDDNYTNAYQPSQMMQDRRLLAALHRRKLKSLCISLQDPFPEISRDPWWDLDYSIPLKGFRDLISLEIYNMWAPPDRFDRMCKNLAESLHNNQSLRKLGLAMAAEQDHDLHPPVVALEECRFLETLCRYYKAKHNSKPLELHTVLLGHKSFGFQHNTDSPTDFLEHLMQPEKLETFHVFNGYVTEYIEDENEVPLKLDWTGLKKCKSLRQVSLARLEPDARRWLNEVGASIEELMIMDHYKRYELGLNNFGALRLPNLSMLSIREVSTRNRSDDGSSDEEIIHDTEHGGERLNGPRVHIDRALMTVLDRLHDGGQNLTRLALAFDFSAQWERFTTHLPKLTKLAYLRLSKRSSNGGNYPPKIASLWDDIERPRDLAIQYTKLAKMLCPSLKFVKIGNYCWEITISHEPDVGNDFDTTMQLRQLDDYEVKSIPIFAIHTFTAQSGLPDIEPPERARTELEIRESEELGNIIEEAGDDVALFKRLMIARFTGEGMSLD